MGTNTSVVTDSPADTDAKNAESVGFNPTPTFRRELTGREIVTSFYDKGLWHVVIEDEEDS